MRRSEMKSSRKRALLGLGMAIVALALSGCTRIRTHQGYLVDNLLIDSIQPGIDNQGSVEGTLGHPSFTSQFGPQEWYYVARDTRQLAFANPRPSAQTVVRIRFDTAGNVAAIDRTGMEQIARVSPAGGKTPTLGRKRTLFEEIFGNIGAVGAGGAGSSRNDNTGSGPNGS